MKHNIIDNRTEINRLKAENARLQAENEKYRRCFQGESGWVLIEPGEHARLEAKLDELKEEVTYQKQKAQEMIEFICECVAKGEFKAFKNGSVKFGKTTKGVKR